MTELTRGRGRPRNISNSGLTIEQWLKAFLSGGSRPSEEIKEAGKLQGFGWATVRRGKDRLGTIVPVKVGHLYHWKDKLVPDKKVSEDKTDKLIHKVEELVRLNQTSRIVTADGTTAAPDPNEVDKYGFLVHSPEGYSTVSVLQIHERIKQLLKTDMPHERVVTEIFEWAYPAAKQPESVIAGILRSYISVPFRKNPAKVQEDVAF